MSFNILENLSDEQIKEVANKFVRHYFIDMIEMFDNTVSSHGYIGILLKWIEISEFKYRIYEDRQLDYTTYKFQFDLGLKFSQFMANLIRNTMESLGQTGIKVEVTEHLVILRLPKSILWKILFLEIVFVCKALRYLILSYLLPCWDLDSVNTDNGSVVWWCINQRKLHR